MRARDATRASDAATALRGALRARAVAVARGDDDDALAVDSRAVDAARRRRAARAIAMCGDARRRRGGRRRRRENRRRGRGDRPHQSSLFAHTSARPNGKSAHRAGAARKLERLRTIARRRTRARARVRDRGRDRTNASRRARPSRRVDASRRSRANGPSNARADRTSDVRSVRPNPPRGDANRASSERRRRWTRKTAIRKRMSSSRGR